MRRIAASILGTVALLLGGIFAGPAAQAGGGLPLVLTGSSPQLCIVTHGPYAQVTLQTAGCGSFFFAVQGPAPGGQWVSLTDGNGNCLEVNRAGTAAVIKPRACRPGEWWIDRLSPPAQGADDTYTWAKSDDQLGVPVVLAGEGVVTSDSPAYRVWASP